MKFSAYQQKNQLGPAPNMTSNARVLNDGGMALARAQGDFGKVLAAGVVSYTDRVNNAKALEANNEYNRLMSEKTAELLQNKEGMALNTVENYDKAQQEVMQQIQKKYGGILRFGKTAEVFHEYTMRDNAQRRANMVRYQAGELEKYELTGVNNQIEDCKNQALSEGATVASVGAGLNRLGATIYNFYAPRYGDEKAKSILKAQTSELVAQNIKVLINNGNTSGAKELLNAYGNTLDSKYRSELQSLTAKLTKVENISNAANELFKNNKNVTWDDCMNYVKSRGKGSQELEQAFSEWEGKRGDNGRVACAEMVGKIGRSAGNKFLTDEADKGVTWVPTMVEDAKKAGIKVDTENLTPQAGDVIVYGDNDHVVIADGKGGAVGNSTSNEKVMRYDDYKSIRGGDVTAIIRTGGARSEFDMKQEADQLYAETQKLYGRQQHENNQYIRQANTDFESFLLKKADAGENITLAEAKGFMSQYLTGDPEIDNKLLLKAMSASGASSGKGGAGKASKEQSLLFKTNFKSMLKYMDSEEAADFIDAAVQEGRLTLRDYIACAIEIGKKVEGKGDYKYDWAGIKNAVKSKYDGEKENFDVQYSLAQERTQKEIDAYRVEHKHEPTQKWVEDKMAAALTSVQLDDSWFGGLKASGATLWDKNIFSYERRANGWYFITTKAGKNYSVSPEQMKKIAKGTETAETILAEGVNH